LCATSQEAIVGRRHQFVSLVLGDYKIKSSLDRFRLSIDVKQSLGAPDFRGVETKMLVRAIFRNRHSESG
jgi:hypothetical protein